MTTKASMKDVTAVLTMTTKTSMEDAAAILTPLVSTPRSRLTVTPKSVATVNTNALGSDVALFCVSVTEY